MMKRKSESSQNESREERWLRKMKLYEEKLNKKRRLGKGETSSAVISDERDVHTEDRPNLNDPFIEPLAPVVEDVASAQMEDVMHPTNNESLTGGYVEFYEESIMTETTAYMSPASNPGLEDNELAPSDDFDPALLRELGDVEADPVEFGEELQGDVAARFQKILLEGLKKETKDELLKKYPFPKNVSLAKSPTLNPEISAMLVETCKLRDKRLLTKQDQLGKALSALGKALTGLLKKSPDIPETIRTLNDAGKLLADSHYAETDTRRSVIIPLIDKSLTDPFKGRKRDTFLFGEKLGELVKDSRGLKKTGQLIQPVPSTSNLNGKGPSSRTTRQLRGGQSFQYRTGGLRSAPAAPTYQYPSRRRAAPPPPPPPVRRQATHPSSTRRPAPPPARAQTSSRRT